MNMIRHSIILLFAAIVLSACAQNPATSSAPANTKQCPAKHVYDSEKGECVYDG